MDSVKELAKQIAKYIKGDKKTKAYDTAAEVKRIVGNTAYVHIPGGVPETPVKLTIDAKVGDTVQVRVANSTAWLVGNSTAPPTDDTKAKEADANAGKAMNKAKEAEAIAEEGLKEAQGTSNYFWHVDGSGAESGAHVTEVPQAEFQANPSGSNLLMKANSLKIRRGLTTLAQFTNASTDFYANGSKVASFGASIQLGANTNTVQGGIALGEYNEGSNLNILEVGNGTAQEPHNAFSITKGGYITLSSGVFMIEEQYVVVSESSIAANGHAEGSEDVGSLLQPGYYPIGIVGFRSPRQATTVRSCYMSDNGITKDGAGTGYPLAKCVINAHIRNDSNSTASGPVDVRVWILEMYVGNITLNTNIIPLP